MFDQITILGSGLLGASLALAAKRASAVDRVHVWSRREATREQAAAASWCDATFESPEKACEGSDLVVICTPVDTIVPLLQSIAPHLRHGALVTDVGSTKGTICLEAHQALGASVDFIGSHPMAGSEQTGMAHAHADLFKNAACIVTPVDAQPAALAKLIAFWEALGMRVSQTTPETHDAIVAHISHLPHLLASSLCSYLASQDPQWAPLSGGGLRDTTRVAAGDPGLWKQILEQNQVEVLAAIEGFELELKRLKTALQQHDSSTVTNILETGQSFRQKLTR